MNHISYSVADYGRARDFYADLLGMQVSGDTGEQCTLAFGNTFIVARRTEQADHKAYIDHFAITIDNWNNEAVEAETQVPQVCSPHPTAREASTSRIGTVPTCKSADAGRNGKP